MARIVPFAGWRFSAKRGGLGPALCPPYDVIGAEQAGILRRRPLNAIHLELPAGHGAAKYSRAASLWKRWRQDGLVRRDAGPCFYLCEETFRQNRGLRRRFGFIGALDVTPKGSSFVLAHERTLPKPKEDRLNLLSALRVNVSPIFGVFPDDDGKIRRLCASLRASRPAAAGRMPGGASYRLWLVDDPAATERLSAALAGKKILIADGHHRFEVGKAFYKRSPSRASSTILAYFCAEQDKGLLVWPTHRVLGAGSHLRERAARKCRMTQKRSLGELTSGLAKSRNPYAFGLWEGGFFSLCEPKSALGCRSRLCVEWVSRRLLAGAAAESLRYTHDAKTAVSMAARGAGATVLVKPFSIAGVRRAVGAVGLLPPKSTYFHPKVATGLVFKAL